MKSKLRVLVTHQIQFLSNVKKIYIVKDVNIHFNFNLKKIITIKSDLKKGTLEKTNGFQELCALYPSIIDEIQVRFNHEFSSESRVSMSSNSISMMHTSNISLHSNMIKSSDVIHLLLI